MLLVPQDTDNMLVNGADGTAEVVVVVGELTTINPVIPTWIEHTIE